MADTTARSEGAARALDAAAVNRALRRLGAAPAAPWLHGEVARRMAERLAIVKLQPQAVLDWSSFLGAGAAWLDAAYPAARRIVVEPTPALRERAAGAGRPRWWQLGRRAPQVFEAEAVPAGSVQLVWANMALHATLDPPAVLAQWQRALAVGGFVMFSCFGPDTARELRALYHRLGWAPPGAPFVDMHDLGDMALHAGFADPVMDQEQIVLNWPDATALVAELRGLGGNVAPGRLAGLRTPRWRARLLHELQALAGADGRPHMSFEIVYGHAFKAAPRMPVQAETIVPLDEMRAAMRRRR
jgi:malonyl-CoA O-methyltransferase